MHRAQADPPPVAARGAGRRAQRFAKPDPRHGGAEPVGRPMTVTFGPAGALRCPSEEPCHSRGRRNGPRSGPIPRPRPLQQSVSSRRRRRVRHARRRPLAATASHRFKAAGVNLDTQSTWAGPGSVSGSSPGQVPARIGGETWTRAGGARGGVGAAAGPPARAEVSTTGPAAAQGCGGPQSWHEGCPMSLLKCAPRAGPGNRPVPARGWSAQGGFRHRLRPRCSTQRQVQSTAAEHSPRNTAAENGRGRRVDMRCSQYRCCKMRLRGPGPRVRAGRRKLSAACSDTPAQLL